MRVILRIPLQWEYVLERDRCPQNVLKINVAYLEELVESLFTLPVGAGIPGVPWVLFDQLSDVFEGGVQSDLFAFFQESSVVVFLFGNQSVYMIVELFFPLGFLKIRSDGVIPGKAVKKLHDMAALIACSAS